MNAEHKAIVLDSNAEHEATISFLHQHYKTEIHQLKMHFEMTSYAIQKSHEMWVHNLRGLNFFQGLRQEAALKSMRELRDKTRKDHLKEIQDIRLQYDSEGA